MRKASITAFYKLYKPGKKVTKIDQSNAERAAQHYLASQGFTIQRRAIRTKYQKVDFFGSDIIAKNYTGTTLYAQVTTGGYEAIRKRKKKLEELPWNPNETVWILVMNKEKKGRMYQYYFRKLYFDKQNYMDWVMDDQKIIIPREWFRKYEG